ncbi:hypothetical protein V6N13_124531 [Hibiscus sabdariffa]
MVPVSSGAVQSLSTGLLPSTSSWLSSFQLPYLLLLARVPIRRSLANYPPDVLWFFLRSFGVPRSKRAFLRVTGLKEMASKPQIWLGPMWLLKLLFLLFP